MLKTIKYTIFITVTIGVILLFITSKNYSQLIFASLLYPVLVVFAFRIFPRKGSAPMITIERTDNTSQQQEEEETPNTAGKKVEVSDVDRRAFLKLIGAAGLSFFLLSIFNRRARNIPFVKNVTGPDITAIEDVSGNKIDPAQTQPTDGYRISEVDDNLVTFYGFIKKGGAWFIMKEDTENGSFRYVKGNSNFSVYWNNREKLSYDYYSNVF